MPLLKLNNKDKKLKVYGKRLDRLGLKNRHLLQIEMLQGGLENFKFGGKSGPVFDFETVLHELSHMIQFDPAELYSRIKTGQIEFKYPPLKEFMGQYYREPQTFKGFLREVETFAIQTILLEKTGKKFNLNKKIQEYKETSDFLDDCLLYRHAVDEKKAAPFEAVFKSFYEKWKQEDIQQHCDRVLEVLNSAQKDFEKQPDN